MSNFFDASALIANYENQDVTDAFVEILKFCPNIYVPFTSILSPQPLLKMTNI